jgi:predicted nucleotidyltransferase
MHPVIAERREAIAELCRRHGVRRLEVFGSGARADDFDPDRSDVDFLVEFESSAAQRTLTQFFSLRDGLAAILGRPVDLVAAGCIVNPYVRAEVERTREPVYAP